jgi:hypothetical protein
MIYLAWIISLIGVFLLGYHYGNISKKVKQLEVEVKKKIEKPQEEPESMLIDELDPVQTAQYELEQQNKRLNGE